jgi:hypothetical protein
MTMDIRNDHPFTAKEVAWLEGRCQTGRSPRPGCTGCSPSAETRSRLSRATTGQPFLTKVNWHTSV